MEIRELIGQIRQCERPDREEELRLFARVEAGVVAEAMLSGRLPVSPVLARPEELEQLVTEGREAQQVVWGAFLPMVVKLATSAAASGGADPEDLAQAGCVGLAEAVMRFDPRRGTRFSTVAWDWIRRRVWEEALSSGSGRPVWRRRTEVAVAARERLLTTTLGRRVSDAEIAEAMGRSPEWVRQRRDSGDDVPHAEVPVVPELVLDVEPECHRYPLALAVAQLPDQERRVVRMRHGFEGRPSPRSEIADELGVSERTVRRIEERALARLRRTIEEWEAAA